MDDEGVDLGLVVGDSPGAVEGFVVAEERHDRVGFQVEQPLVRGGEEALAVMLRVFRVKLLRARERPLAGPRRMRAEGRRVARAAHVAENQALRGEAQLQLGLEATVVGVAFGEAIAEEDHALAGRGRGHGLRADRRRGRRDLRGRVRRRRALAVVGPVRRVGLGLAGREQFGAAGGGLGGQ